MENNQEIPLPKGYTQVSIEESIPLPKGYTEVLGETAPDVKKKEQTKPVQEAPLPGLGGVSEEPTPSPSVGRLDISTGTGALASIQPTPERKALSDYEKNQKALSDIDKQIASIGTSAMAAGATGMPMMRRDVSSDQLKSQREKIYSRSKSLIPEARKITDEIVSSEISDSKYRNFLTDDGTSVDPVKAGDLARKKAKEYGLEEDGYFFDLLRNSIETNVESARINSRVEKNFDEIMQKKHGMNVDEYAESMMKRSADAVGITKLVGERDLSIANVYDRISTLANNEVEKIQIERYGKTATEYATDIRGQYDNQISQLNSQFSPLIVDGKFTGDQQQFEAYKSSFDSISNNFQEQINQIISQEIKDVAAVNAKYDLRYKRQADEIANLYAKKIDEKAKLVDPIIRKEIESVYKSAVGKVYEDEDKAKKAAAVYSASSYLGPAGAAATFLSKPFTKSILDQTSTYLRAAGFQELSEKARQYAKSYDIGEFKLDNAEDFLDPLNVLGATGQTVGGMVPTLIPSVAVGALTGGVGWLPTLAAGATGFTVESVGIAQDAYDDRFAATGSVSEAEEARDKAWKAQTIIMPAYAFDNFPIFGEIAGGVGKRVILGALAEYGTELMQEYPQNVFEEVIRNDENLSEAMKYVSFDGFKKTALNLTPVLAIGGVGQARQISAENNIKRQASSLAAKMNIGQMTDSALEQNMLYMTANKGKDFALAFVDAQLRTGNISESMAERATNAINDSQSIIDRSKDLRISNEAKLVISSLDLKIRAAKAKIESETDPMLKSVEESKLKELERQSKELATTGKTDYAVVTFNNETFEILTPQEFELMTNNEKFVSSFSSGDIKVEMFGDNQAKMSEMLNSKVKEAVPTESALEEVDYIESLDNNELVTFNVETLDEVPDEFKDKAVKRDDLSVDVREKILGLPIGKKKKVTVKKGGYSYTITGNEAKEYVKKKQETVPTEAVAEEAAPVVKETEKSLEEGKVEITDVKSGTHTSTKPIKIFKGIGGKKDLKGIRINAHKGAEGVFTAVDKNLAEDYARGEGISETVLPAGTTFEVVEIDGTGMTPGQYRDAEVKAINESKADVVKLITVDGKIKAGTKKQEQYVIKNEKLIEDAIQEQAAGKVPVQPEAKAGKKVEEGKPQAEPEVVAEKGEEEVSEEEKVKAAKENLNNVWEKWRQSQKNLGVAFDPKSKANEDMELLEAFLTYIKALGIKTAKDIQKVFNDFTGGEATLDDAGAEFIAEKVKPKKGETNYEKTEEMNRSIIEKASKSLFNKAKKLFMSARRTFVKYSSNTRELLKSTNDIMPVYDYFVSRLGSPGNANFIFQEAKKKIYDDLFPTLRKHLDSLIKYRRIITINESRVESNRKGLDSLGVSEMFEKAGSEAVAAFKEAVTAAIEYANVSEEQSLDAKSIKKAAIQSLKESDWYRSLSDSKKARFEKQLNEDLGFLKSENFTGKDSNGNPIGLSVARGIISDIEAVVGKKDFEKISKMADLYFDEFKKLLKKDLEKGIISQEQYDAMIGKDYSPRIFLQHIFGFDNEFVNNVDDRRLAREYSLSSDAIKTLKDGLKDLYVDDAYWELITDSEKLLAGYISSRERRYQFNDLNKKLYNTLEKLQQEYETLKSKKNKTDEELLRYKKLGNIFDAFSLKEKRGHSSVHYYKNGERVSFYMRNDIFEEWYDMRGSYSTDNKIIAFMDYMARLPQRTLQSLATGAAAPLFFVKNVARDFVQMTVISDSYGNWTIVPLSFAKAMKDFFKASVHIYKEDELYKEAMDAGISMEFLYMAEGLDLSDKISEGLLKLAEKSKPTQSGAMALRKGILALSKAGIAANRYGELGFRIAIYERIRNAEYKKIESNKDSMTSEEYMEAMEDARKKAARASADFMNFREGGSFTKGINPYASYINAAVIGADTIAMEFKKNPVAFTFRMTQGVAFLTSTVLLFGLLMLSMFDEDEEDFDDDTGDKDEKGKDKKYDVLRKYYKIIDSVSPYYRNTYYIIPTGGKDENGNYNVIRIAKNQALIPLSYATEKAMRHNLEKHLLRDDKVYDLENLKKDAFEMNYLFHEYVMPINLSPIDEKGKNTLAGERIASSLIQKNIPLSLTMILLTGYDPYTNRYISPEKKFQTELDSKYLIGWNDPEIQGFYKKIAKELNSEITPAEMKVMVEKIVTRPENNPYVASVYALLDRRSKVSDIIKKDRSLVGDIANMVKKSVVIPADYVERSRDFSSSKIEDEIRKYKEEKYVISNISSTVMKDLKEKVKKGDIDLSDSSEENKMKIKEYVSEEVDKQVGVFSEGGVNITNKDKMEIEDKILRSITPMLKLPIQPTQYRVPLVVDRDANVMAYRFLDEFGSLTVIEKNNDEFKAIMKQMFSEYTRQYGSEMSNKKFDDFVRKYEEIKNDEELLRD